MSGARRRPLAAIFALTAVVAGVGARAEEPALPAYLADRGEGIPTSLFGTYIGQGDFIVYPFYEYTKTTQFEYKPSELGFVGETDFLGQTVEQEYLVYLAYGFTKRLAVELEVAAYATTSFDKAPDDPSAVPARLEESGLGDVDMQLRWAWTEESASRPAMYSFFELTPPFQRGKVLIGTQDWEASMGFGVIRGFRWGTITGRAAIAWDGADSKLDLGEYAFEYLKRLSPGWRIVATVEGETDEISLIGEAQWEFSRVAVLKLNCGFGLTPKAPDIAPEVGVLFRF
jgi:hypothetical protein